MELFGTLEGSLQFKYILECPTSFYVQAYVQAYVQEYTRDLWNSLEGCGLFSCLPP